MLAFFVSIPLLLCPLLSYFTVGETFLKHLILIWLSGVECCLTNLLRKICIYDRKLQLLAVSVNILFFMSQAKTSVN